VVEHWSSTVLSTSLLHFYRLAALSDPNQQQQNIEGTSSQLNEFDNTAVMKITIQHQPWQKVVV